MDFAKKKQVYTMLQDDKCLNADLNFLRKLAPRNRMARRNRVSQSDVLWALLNLASEKEIVDNRKQLLDEEKQEIKPPTNELASPKSKPVKVIRSAPVKKNTGVKKKKPVSKKNPSNIKSSSNKKKKNTQI